MLFRSVIALFYGHSLDVSALIGAIAAIATFATLQHRGSRNVLLYALLAACAWALMLRSGVHATVAGVALGLSMSVAPGRGGESPADAANRLLRPVSAGVCVPVFALVSAGVSVDLAGLGSALRSPLLIGIVCGLVIGQPLGVTAGAFLAARITRTPLNPGLTWWDVAVVGTLAAIGFTVALLVSHVSFVDDSALLTVAKLSIVTANLCAIVLSVSAMTLRTALIGRYRS